jgi:head-tail adaptor
MTLPAGDLSWRVKFQQRTQAIDPEFGGLAGDPVWTDVVTVWARRTNTLSATAEAVAAGATVAPVQVRFDIRPRAVDPAWRMVGVGGFHDGVIYDIKNVGVSNDRSEMAIIAVSGANNG